MDHVEIFVPGKLLIAGEYVVLDGALSYAIKTKHGQYISLQSGESGKLSWEARDHEGQIWLSFSFDLNSGAIEFNAGSDPEGNLVKLLLFLRESGALKVNEGYRIETRLTFPRAWGLGSSSSMVAGLAHLFNMNPFELLNHSFGGSGYDVAVGYENSGLFYKKGPSPLSPVIRPFNWKPPFYTNLYFIYLNEKRNSREAMEYYQRYKDVSSCSITDMTELTEGIIETRDLDEFAVLIRTHEKIMARVLHKPRIKEERFPDFPGEIKSLGAWGGDFCLATGNDGTPDYFRSKGYPVIMDFNEMTGSVD